MSEEQKAARPVPRVTGEFVYLVSGDRGVIRVFRKGGDAKRYAEHLIGDAKSFRVEQFDVSELRCEELS